MGRGYYIIELSQTKAYFFISAFNVEKPQTLLL